MLRGAPRCFIVAVMVASIGGCGGGSGGSSSSGDPSAAANPSAVELASAQAAGVRAMFHPDTGLVDIQWNDTFATATSYRLESQADDSSWTTLNSIPGSGGKGSTVSLSRPVQTTTTFRMLAVLPDHAVTLYTARSETTFVVTTLGGSSSSAIVSSQSEPVTGAVNLSVVGFPSALSVGWYADLTLIGTSNTPDRFPIIWDSSAYATGNHLIIARVEAAPASFIELRRSFAVNTPRISATLSIFARPPNVYVVVSPVREPQFQFTSVSASLDGQSLGTLTEPNGVTSGLKCVGSGLCDYFFPLSSIASGTHQITATVTDSGGESDTFTTTQVWSNPPALQITNPVNGQVVQGTLEVAGTATSDKSETVTTTGTLGGFPILNSQSSSFHASFDLTGVPAGNYLLRITATDTDGQSTEDLRTVTVSP